MQADSAMQTDSAMQIDIMFTHDIHSHLNSAVTVENGETVELGGFARLKAQMDAQKRKNPNTLILDGGDFSMGTLVQTVFEDEAAELRMLGEIGTEVTTIGNHEFDYRSKGLANMLNSATKSGEKLPELVVCNVDWETMEAAGLSEGQKLLAEQFRQYGVKDYVMLQKGDVSVAVIGVFGKDALECAPTCELLFQDPVEAVKETVAQIQEKEKADLIVCVSHSGTWEDESKSEDELLAKSVPELDLIVSAHTHSVFEQPMIKGDTYIVSAGEYGKRLGSLSMEQKPDGRWRMTSYELKRMTVDLPADEATQRRADEFFASVDTHYLSGFGYTKDQVLATSAITFCSLSALSTEHTEHDLGNLLSDAYVYAVTHADGFDGNAVDVAVVPSGTVRDTFAAGDITVENVFNSFSLGIGADGVPGYPLISVYLTGEELKTVAEIDASISDYMTTARLSISGMSFTFNPNRMILNKVTEISLVGEGETRIELEKDKLYRVVADLYSGQMLSAVTDMSYGLLSIVPKYADGTPIENFEDAIILENGAELKAWDAIARYMESFPDTDGDGIGNVPEYYAAHHGRKVVEDSTRLGDLIKSPNRYAGMILAIVLILLLVLVLLVILVVKLIKRSKKNKRQSS
ncbi:MAG: bifunctional UDP-sugar hydrolase/5'-nucleotidase [Clostridiales bacterium]|nr:bifunctional UDP-sugar hydrolase/5'-nucleotidase [Clostridiales bacterium]